MAQDFDLGPKVDQVNFGLNLAWGVILLLGIGAIAGSISGIDQEKRIHQLEIEMAGLKEKVK